MAITTRPHTTARHTGTTGPSGSVAACSSEPDLGSTALATSTATSITSSIGRTFAVLAVLFGAFGLKAGASATLLIEEPYGKLGFFTATGHSAVYLSGVCAQTPLILRRCAPGESGVVLSRYDGVGGYDWIAIPLVPYFYAVERAEDVPLFAAASIVAGLRGRYRRKYLMLVVPGQSSAETAGGHLNRL